ncbi:DUF3781 domain-containing protein [Polaribacter batillariae]|uniref:DUF3781 domain-containing protein n=1 Tax=Polaribacter batillariae TaxID=2808900 RepID=A0ABX7SVI7_9FLAO|nr:DUF3781 domain-containing protein [Polaribacter batillariae]QTD37338.1 DUF3781 domain-containing protein [Polaribacter batillariae]
MKINKQEIIENHCYTKLVYERINKKLGTNFSKDESEHLILKVLKETSIENYQKIGKNFYVTSKEFNIKITINSNTFRIITVDKVIR